MCPLCCEWPRKSLLTVVHTQFQRPSLVLACKSIFFCFYNYNYNERPFVQQSTLEERKLPLLTSHRKSNMFWSTITFTLTNIFGPFETFSTVKTCNSTPTTVPGAISTEKGSMSTFDTIYCVLFLPLINFVYEDQTPDWLYSCLFSPLLSFTRADTTPHYICSIFPTATFINVRRHNRGKKIIFFSYCCFVLFHLKYLHV